MDDKGMRDEKVVKKKLIVEGKSQRKNFCRADEFSEISLIFKIAIFDTKMLIFWVFLVNYNFF